MSFSRLGGAVAAFLFLALSAFADQPWNGAPFSADPEVLRKAAEGVTGEDAEKNGVVLILEEATVVFDAQGRATRTERLIYRVVNEAGAEAWSSVEAPWSPWYNERPIIDARVITKDGSVHRLDPKSFGTGDADEEPDMYSDTRVLSGPLPAIAPGSVVEQLITYHEKNPLSDAGITDRLYFGRNIPLQQARLVLEYPASVTLRLNNETKPEIQPVRTEENGVTRLLFEASPVAAVPRGEWNAPQSAAQGSYVAYSTGKSWQEVARRSDGIVEKQIGDTSLAKLTAQVVGDAKEPREIAARILAHVAHIRYAGVEFGEGSIVPRPPSSTLSNKYGDCKDKATLVVTMLRQAGVPAHTALLRAGTGYDAEPDLPGLGYFNHVIVVTDGPNPLWMDPTDEYARAGELPEQDQGRLALIARPDSTTLVRVPLSESLANRNVETREFALAEEGHARVVETSEYYGADERSSRRSFATMDTKARAEQLKKYVEGAYAAKKLVKHEVSDVSDLSKPFRIRVEAEDAARGNTVGGEAAVGIFLNRLTGDMPWDLHGPDPDDEDESAEEKERKPRKAEYVFTRPYVTELHYRIQPPPGYVVRELPKSETAKLATATLERKYSAGADGMILADYRFDSGPRRITAPQYEELRTAVAKLENEKLVLLMFDQIARKHLDAGDVGLAIAEHRRLASLHPKEALHHIDIARTLLNAGFGAAARREAKKAVEIDPKSARAHAILGLALVNDLVGREFKKGSDRLAAIQEYRKAKELDPTDVQVRAELAMVLQFGDNGQFGRNAPLGDAIAEYEGMKKDKLGDADAIDGLMMPILAHAGRFADLKALCAATKETEKKDTWKLVAIAALDGGAAAVEASKTLDLQKRRTALSEAAGNLGKLRLYAAAADLVEVAAQGSPNAAELRARVDLLRKAVRHEDRPVDANDPKSIFVRFMSAFFKGGNGLKDLIADDVMMLGDEGKGQENLINQIVGATGDMDTPDAPLYLDAALAVLQFSQDGDEETGWRVRGRGNASGTSSDTTFYVIREKGTCRIAGVENEPSFLGYHALKLAQAGKVDAAKKWLDWARDEASGSYDEDDPVDAEPFVGLWKKGKDASQDEMLLAAASLMRGSKKAAAIAIPILEKARTTTGADVQLRIDRALVEAYEKSERWADMLATAERLSAKYPESPTAFQATGRALAKLDRYSDIHALAQKRLAAIPADPAALRVLTQEAMHRRAYDEALTYMGQVTEGPEVTPIDYNEHAWLALFGKLPLETAIEEARQGLSSIPNSYAILNTLAALYAEHGKSSEAHDTLLQSLAQRKDGAVEGPDWYVLGRIAENYGIQDVAREAYALAKVGDTDNPGSTFELAQKRLAVLKP
jgi:tetratricopeptide (TPR) repeat protein/transglutaminase-like putative cysteine protease